MRLTLAEKEVLDALGPLDSILVDSKDMKQRHVVHMNGHANLRRHIRVGLAGEKREEDGVGALKELLLCVCVDIASDNEAAPQISMCLMKGKSRCALHRTH